MNPTYYGLDIILYPEKKRGKALHKQGKVIEINGTYSGSSFYKLGDYSFYDRVMGEIKKIVGDRLLLVAYDPRWDFKQKDNAAMKEYRKKKQADALEKTKQWINFLQNSSKNNFYLENDFLIEKTKKENPLNNIFFSTGISLFLKYAEKNNILYDSYVSSFFSYPLTKYISYKLDKEKLPNSLFNLENVYKGKPIGEVSHKFEVRGLFEEKFAKNQDIGLVWTHNLWDDSYIDAESFLGEKKVFNNFFNESIIENKFFTYFFTDLLRGNSKGKLNKFFPKTFIYGMGMHTQEDFRQWYKSIKGNLFVKKPIAESNGTGVDFLTRSQLKKYDRSPFRDDGLESVKKGYVKLLMDCEVDSLNLDDKIILFQENIESKLVKDPDSGEKYPACARAIVMNGKYMGSIWRSSIKTAKTANSLTDRFRHNTGAGSKVLPVSQKDDKIIGEIAENSVKEFEAASKLAKEKFPKFVDLEKRLTLEKIKYAMKKYSPTLAREVKKDFENILLECYL